MPALPASRPPWWGYGAIALAAALWAVAATTASALFDSGVATLELVQARAFITTVGLAVVPSVWRRRPGRGLPWTHLAALGASIAAVNAAYYLAIDRLDVAVAIVLQYTAPALVVLWVALRTRRTPDSMVVIALIAATAGVVLASELPSGDIGTLSAAGVGFGLAASVLFATYTLLSERAGAVYGSLGALARAFPVASLIWVVYQVPRGLPSTLWADGHLAGVVFVGIGGTLVPFVLFIWGVTQVRADRAAIAATLEPVLAAGVAWVWLGQSLSTMQMAGGVLVIGAVLTLQLHARRATLAPEP